VYIDPYLSNSVQENETDDLARLIPIPVPPCDITDADWVVITHEHRDHCDLETLLPIASASKKSCFLGPPKVVYALENAGISSDRIWLARCGVARPLGVEWEVHPVPSAHPRVERDDQGACRWLGYVMRAGSRYIYHAGDTSADAEVISAVKAFGKIDMAFLPVNERNYYRERRGIVGNMSVREAFHFAEEIGASALVPTHWDMFDANCVYKEEIELLYEKISPEFELLFEPEMVE
jgi:L-ascorbate metabolism protein UlaG (beta-lactamase superfamily)